MAYALIASGWRHAEMCQAYLDTALGHVPTILEAIGHGEMSPQKGATILLEWLQELEARDAPIAARRHIVKALNMCAKAIEGE